ncbi:hypothetical protein LV779_11730 [Streptomyces thinghirensis]|nr:hypothetical protein [Streptomyces thinghirensis]
MWSAPTAVGARPRRAHRAGATSTAAQRNPWSASPLRALGAREDLPARGPRPLRRGEGLHHRRRHQPHRRRRRPPTSSPSASSPPPSP